jgi:hypothetical protein
VLGDLEHGGAAVADVGLGVVVAVVEQFGARPPRAPEYGAGTSGRPSLVPIYHYTHLTEIVRQRSSVAWLATKDNVRKYAHFGEG